MYNGPAYGDYGGSSYAGGDLWGSIKRVAGGIARGVGGAVGSAVTGGNPLLGFVGGVVQRGSHPSLPAPGGGGGPGWAVPSPFGPLSPPGFGSNPGVQRFDPLGTGAAAGGSNLPVPITHHMYPMPWGQTVGGSAMGESYCKIKGYHLNKAGYFRHTPTGELIYIEKNSACVKNRRMNPCNGRALKRALRRATAFKRVAMKSIRLIDAGKKPKRFGGFKTRGRKK